MGVSELILRTTSGLYIYQSWALYYLIAHMYIFSIKLKSKIEEYEEAKKPGVDSMCGYLFMN